VTFNSLTKKSVTIRKVPKTEELHEIKRGGPPVDFFSGVILISWYDEISLGTALNLSACFRL
jgi:hypothetical protein